MVFVCTRCKREVDTPGQFCPFCGTPAPPPPQERSDPLVGRTIASKYFVNQRLGSGGMGQVYKATDVILDRPVALKMLNRSLLADASMVQRFHREARASSRLNHANCITILDFGQTEDESLFIAMEFLAGRALSKVIAEEAPLAQARAVRIVAQILAALAEAHGNGVIHRDLKPSNVMLETRREEPDFVKVLDFGIAKLSGAGDGGSQLTGTGIVCGTPGYMSPEQARGEDLDARSDLYAVGVILYELLTGRLPFDSETPMGYVTKHLMDAPIPLGERRPDLEISPELEALTLRALSKERDARPASAEAFREELLAARIDMDAVRPAPGPASPSTMFIPAPGGRSSPVPGARADVPSGLSRAAGEGTRPPTPSSVRRGTPSPARPATPSPARPATPSPARVATPDPSRPAADREAPATPRPPRPSRPAARPGRNRTLMIAGGAAAAVVVVVAYFLLRADPFSQPAAKGRADGDATLTLGATGPKAPTPAAPQPATAPVAPQPATPVVATPQPAPTPPPVVVAPPRPEPKPPPVVAPPPPRPEPRPVAAKPRKGSGVIEAAEGLKVLKVPAAGSGQGLLAVTASPWGVVSIDGKEIGETPREARVGEGYYKVKVAHPTLGVRETSITVPAGRRAAFNVSFSR
jgi:serine/threonine protein kinase